MYLSQFLNGIKMTKLSLSLVICFSIPILSIAQEPVWKKWEVEADTLMERQDFDQAIKLYSKVIQESKLTEKENFRSVYKRAIGYYSLGDFENALKDIALFIPEFPQNYQAHVLAALIHRQTGDAEKQMQELNKAIELQSSNLELIKWRGTLYVENGEFALAKRDLLWVRPLQDDPELETNLGLVYYAAGKLDSALISINRSIELDATYEPAYLYAGSFCLEAERYELALKYLNLALLVDPENVNALFYKGVALVQLNRIAQGCSALARAFKEGNDGAADYLKEHCYDVDR